MKHRVKQTLDNILQAFKNGEISYVVALATYPTADIPCSKWSLLNRTLMYLAKTTDARGIKQWNHVNRAIKKGETGTGQANHQ